MAGNTVKLEFAGDADRLSRAGKQAEKATDGVAESATSAGEDFDKASKQSSGFTDKIGKLGAGVSGMTDAVDSAGAAVSALSDLQQAGREKAARLARATLDVSQAQEDLNQALRDGSQATIDADQAEVDLQQARLDQATALKDYNAAVKEHGKGSAEARQALIDMQQAGVDVKQATEDQSQALRDASQATIDAKGAQLDLNDAMSEAHPTDLQGFSDKLNLITPVLSGLVGIIGLVTAAQWLWNIAMDANPIGVVILLIAAVVTAIVLIATKTDWFQRLWKAAWSGIKSAASNTWNFIKQIPGWLGSAFRVVADVITRPFRLAFNGIASAWNNTVGRLAFTVPGWIPGIGGNSFAVPKIPHFHDGGEVPGLPGSEMLAVLQAGETVIPASDSGGVTHVVVKIDRDTLLDVMAKGSRRGGPKFA